MVAIYYPFWQGGAKWEELKYSLRSLEKHLKEDFKVYLVGDKPDWLSDEVVHIPYERVDIGAGSALHNAIEMQRLFLKEVKDADEFIRMNDDIYLVDDIVADDLRVTRIVRTAEDVHNIKTGGLLWKRYLFNTIKAIREHVKKPLVEGYTPGYMCSAHCPELFNRENMHKMYRDFNLGKNKYLIGTLYFNLFPYAEVRNDRKTERALFYGSEDAFGYSSVDIGRKLKGKKYLNHNDIGLNDALKKKIASLFKHKSKFEV